MYFPGCEVYEFDGYEYINKGDMKMYNCTIQGISLDDVYYSLTHRVDDREALDWAFQLLDDVDCAAAEFPKDVYDDDALAETLSVIRAYARGFFEMSDVMSILQDEYPWATFPWDDKYLKLGVR